MWTLLREISFRHLIFAPLRTALVIFGIALGVCMLSAMLATNETLSAAFEDMVDRVAGKADLTVVGSQAGIPSSLTGEVADLEGVEHAAAMLEVITHIARPGGATLLVLGVDLLGDTFFLPFAQEGDEKVIEDPLAFVNQPNAVLVSRKLAENQKLKVGDELPLVTAEGNKTFIVRGLLEDKGPAASYGGQVVVMFIDAAQVSFSRGYAVDRIDVVISENHEVADVKQRIDTLLAGRAKVDEPDGRTRRLVASLDAFRNGLNMSALIALGVSTFLIYNAVSVSVAQRRREVGVLRALGVVRGRMVRLFLLEALVMAAIGVVLGLLLSQQLASFALASITGTIARLFVAIQPKAPEITMEVAGWSALSGFVTTLIASYLPARSTNRVDPAEALRSSRSTSQSSTTPWGKLGLLGVAIALCAPIFMRGRTETTGYFATLAIMIGFSMAAPMAVKILRRALLRVTEYTLGIPGRIALDNVERTLSRSVTTVVALMLAIALSMTVGAYAVSFDRSLSQWIDDAFPSDAMVTAGSPTLDRNHVAFAPSLVDKIAAVQGVEALSRMREVTVEVGTRQPLLNAVDTQVTFSQARMRGRGRRVASGPSRFTDDALYVAPRVLISENLAHFSGLEVGEKLELATPSGPKSFEVYAVVVDYSSDQGWLLMDRKWYAEYWQDEPIDAVDVYFGKDADKNQLAELLRSRLGEGASIFVTTHDAMREELRGLASSLFAYAKAPELITLIVAIMGVIGTMLAAVIDRIREIGMLRAIGATRRQIATSMVAEAGFIGLAAALCGVLTGVPQGYIFMRVIGMSANGWSLDYGFPVETAVRVSLFVVVAAALAGYLPGRRAAAMDVKEALSYE
jgi:putative ABC transport system permease protein